MKMNPKWKHDCNKCEYLGSMVVTGNMLDWYTCGTGFNKTVIARRGDDGPEYWSMPVDVMRSGNYLSLKNYGEFVYNGMNILAEEMLKKEKAE